jgi:hypothetical protein
MAAQRSSSVPAACLLINDRPLGDPVCGSRDAITGMRARAESVRSTPGVQPAPPGQHVWHPGELVERPV